MDYKYFSHHCGFVSIFLLMQVMQLELNKGSPGNRRTMLHYAASEGNLKVCSHAAPSSACKNRPKHVYKMLTLLLLHVYAGDPALAALPRANGSVGLPGQHSFTPRRRKQPS